MKKLIYFSCFLFTINTTNAQLPSYLPTNGLIAWYPFTGNANDSSGNGLNGTVHGATLTTDRFGHPNSAYDFDTAGDVLGSVGQYINVPNNSKMNSTSLSVSAWVMPTAYYWNGNSIHDAVIWSRWDVGASGGPAKMGMWGNTGDFSDMFSISGTDTLVYSGQSLTLGNWQFVSFTISNDTIKNYINGSLVSTATHSGTLDNPMSDLAIGLDHQSNGYWYYWEGKIDDIGMWNRALSQEEISQLYSSSCSKADITTGLIGYYPFTGNANDSSGNGLNGTVHGATLTTDRFGHPNSAYNFDTTGDILGSAGQYINVPYSSKMNSTSLSVTAWVMPTANYWHGNSIHDAVIWSRWDASSDGPAKMGMWGNNGVFSDMFSISGTDTLVYSGQSLTLGNWQFVGFTISDGYIKNYINGDLVSTATYSGTLDNPTSDLAIGLDHQSNGYWYYWEGKIDDIRIYNRSLTDCDVDSLYKLTSNNTTGISNNKSNDIKIHILPNPSSGQFTIKLDGNQNGYNVDIYNVMGMQVYHSVLKNSQSTINLSAQPDGMYFVYVKSEQGIEVGKVLVTR